MMNSVLWLNQHAARVGISRDRALYEWITCDWMTCDNQTSSGGSSLLEFLPRKTDCIAASVWGLGWSGAGIELDQFWDYQCC